MNHKTVQKETNKMKSITIHNLDQSLDEHIREKAKRQGVSLNKTIKSVLEASFGLTETEVTRKNAFMDLFGSWSKKDEREFRTKVKGLENVDKEDWL